MVDYLGKVIDMKSDVDFKLLPEERKLISGGFKGLISNDRKAIRTISTIKKNPDEKRKQAL